MGIPHLLNHLRSYASPFVLSSGGRDANESTAIVDGPGLAYHAYYRALSRRTNARNALEAAPSYTELGGIAVEWLQTLEQHGLRM